MTETTEQGTPSLGHTLGHLLQGSFTAPRATLRQLSGSQMEWSGALIILLGIILLNTLLALAMGREGLGAQFLSSAQSAILASLAAATVIWLLAQLLCAVRLAWQRVHTATILIMIPLVLGPVPVLGQLMLLVVAGLIALIYRDVAGQPLNRSLLLTAMTWAALVALGLIGTRVFG